MTRLRYVLVIMVALAMVASIPNVTLAQYGPPAQGPTGQAGQQAPQPKGGVATVIGVDQPENCLRIRSGPGNSYDVIGCARMGEQLNITGVWTSNDWAQLADNAWVYGPQIQTDLSPPPAAFSQPESYAAVVNQYPIYSDTYDDAYLPDYGYQTYWYGGVPIILYDINVWRRHHPRWWHKGGDHAHKAWDRNRNFKGNVTTGPQRNFVPNRSNASSSNITRFNSGRYRWGSSQIRSGSSQVRSGRTFSTPNTIRMGNIGTRSFSSGRASGLSSTHFNAGTHFSSGAQFRGSSGERHR